MPPPRPPFLGSFCLWGVGALCVCVCMMRFGGCPYSLSLSSPPAPVFCFDLIGMCLAVMHDVFCVQGATLPVCWWVGGCKEGKRCLSAVCCIFRCRAAIVELQEAFFFLPPASNPIRKRRLV